MLLTETQSYKLNLFYLTRISIFFLVFPFVILFFFHIFVPYFFEDAFYSFKKIAVFLKFFGYSTYLVFFFKYFKLFGVLFFYGWLVHCYVGMLHIFDEYLDDTVFKTSKNQIIRDPYYNPNYKRRAATLFVFIFFFIEYFAISSY